MKVKALLSGHNGSKSHEAGAILEGDTDYIRRLLFNGAAEPKDDDARRFVKEKDGMTPKQVKEHPFYNSAIVAAVQDSDAPHESVSVRKTTKKTGAKSKSK